MKEGISKMLNSYIKSDEGKANGKKKQGMSIRTKLIMMKQIKL